MSTRSIVVTHREALAAEGIAAALQRYPQMVVQVARNLQEAERGSRNADAVAIDARLQGAYDVATRIRRRGVRVVMLVDDSSATEGAAVPVDASISLLAEVLCPGLNVQARPLSPLTAREKEILALISRGMAGKQVARQLGISPKTVEHHKTRIFSKLGVPNQTAACLALVRLESVGSGAFVPNALAI